MSTALAYLPTGEERPNLTLRPDTSIAEVALDGHRAVGVRLIDGALLEAGVVILAAGAYGSPVLLQRSGISPAAVLRSVGVPVLERLAAGFDRAVEVASQPSLGALATAPFVRETRTPAEMGEWIRRNAWTYHHPVGTCAIGPDPASGPVVDPGGRVHGFEGLFVADASVMPDIPSVNTHLPTVMVAERLSDRIAQKL